MTPAPPPRRHRHEAVGRDLALDVLVEVSVDGAYANLALNRLLTRVHPERREAALATELVFGTLRLRGRYDAVLAQCSSRDLATIDPVVLDALRMGCHQILTLAVPDYAAVSATVDQVRARRGPGAAKFANAVLRSVTRHPWPEWLEIVAPVATDDPVGRWAIEYSHPEWVIRAFEDALRRQGADGELTDLLRVDDEAAPVSLVARPGRISRDELLELTAGTPGKWSPWAVGVTGDPGRFAPVRDRRAGVQDEGSQLIALAVSRMPAPAGPWLDLCAGPGGKTADLAGLAAAAGDALTAVEQHPHRADLIRSAVAGGPPVTVETADALDISGSFARVLVDAPCTGLGAVRRRPELRWRRSPGDLPQLRAAQRRLLGHALDLVVPGGCVAYVTCSPHPAETHDVVAAALREHPEFRAVPAADLLPEVPDAAVGDAVQLWPQRHDTDAMFLAVLQRQE